MNDPEKTTASTDSMDTTVRDSNAAYWARWRKFQAWRESPEGKLCERALTMASNEAILGEDENCSQKRYREASASSRAASDELRQMIRKLVADRAALSAALHTYVETIATGGGDSHANIMVAIRAADDNARAVLDQCAKEETGGSAV